MRIFFIIDDTLFFLPNWANKVIEKLEKDDKVVGITPLVTKNAPTFYNQVERIFFKLPPSTILKMVSTVCVILIRKLLFDLNITEIPMSIVQVAKKNKIIIIKTSNVNNSDYLHKVAQLKPDLIISSCSQIFHKELLSIPKIACINRHSALLPSYRGVFPVFWAMLAKEKVIGATIHYMVKNIDAGKVIYQVPIPITKKASLFELYDKAYFESIKATIEAIKVIKKYKKPYILKGQAPSYHSFPTENDWKKFIKIGYRFI